jgi:hypothetical protein
MRRTVKGLVDAAALVGDDDAGENLHALFVALADLRVHAHTVADFKRRNFVFTWAAVISWMIGIHGWELFE